jgi:hypothetical protein
MGSPSYMRSVVNRNVVMWRIPVVDKTNVIIEVKLGSLISQAPYPYFPNCNTHYKCRNVDAV